MRRALALVVALGLAGTASAAALQLFWSTTGISDPSLRYSTALTDFQPAYQPPTPEWYLPPGTHDLFLWGQFPAGWENYQIYGLDLKWGPGNTAQHAENVAYRHKWGSQPSQQRWDGSAGIALDGVMAGVTGSGIIWDTNTPAYHLMEPDGLFLIGAAHITGDIGTYAVVSLDFPAPGLGINMRDPNGNEVNPKPDVIPAYVWFIIPEPATGLLALLSVLFPRRRWSRNWAVGRASHARASKRGGPSL